VSITTKSGWREGRKTVTTREWLSQHLEKISHNKIRMERGEGRGVRRGGASGGGMRQGERQRKCVV
jgi:hypothetical protein